MAQQANNATSSPRTVRARRCCSTLFSLASIGTVPLGDEAARMHRQQALALGGDGELPEPFSLLPPFQGWLWFSLSKLLRVLELPFLAFDGGQIDGMCGCFFYGLLALLKTPLVAVFVAIGYLAPSQIAFFANYPRFAVGVRRSGAAVAEMRGRSFTL